MNCTRNLPSYGRWQSRFKGKEVELLSIHTPETEQEKVTDNVRKYVKENGITYPVLVDTSTENWRRWGQRYWPAVLLIDRKGIVRYRWEGELEHQGAGGEKRMADLVEQLLKEKP